MAEALRSALNVSERPSSSYYDMSDRAEGQPTLNRQEEGGRLSPLQQNHSGDGRRNVQHQDV